MCAVCVDFKDRAKGDAEVGEAGTSLSNYGDSVVVTKITEKYQMNIILSPRDLY